MVLVYDGECSLCENFKNQVIKWDRRHRVTPVTLQDPQVDRWLPGMSETDRKSSFHLVWSDGRVKSGPRAIPDVVRLWRGGRVIAWSLEHVPGGSRLMERLYEAIATRRSRRGDI